MEETLRNSGSFTIDFVENEVNKLFLKKNKHSKLDEFPFELSLTLKTSYEEASQFVAAASEDAVQYATTLLSGTVPACLSLDAFSPRFSEHSAAASVAVGGCVRFMSPGESSLKGKTLGRPFCLFVLTVC